MTLTEPYGTLPVEHRRESGAPRMKKLLVLLILVVIGVAVAKKLRDAAI
jgi:hypothetical protein